MSGLPLISHRLFVAALEPAPGRPEKAEPVDRPVEVDPNPATKRNRRAANGSKRRRESSLLRPVMAVENGVVEA